MDDKARLDACVLMGATTNDGCDTASGVAAVKLGDLTMGAVKTRDAALFNGGAGAVPATVSAVGLVGATANYAILKIYRLDASANEVAVTLPFALDVNHGSELRVRVAFTANAPVGAVSGAALRVTASHPSIAIDLPITGQITGCPAGKGDCDADPANGCEVDLQTDLASCGACAAACGSANAAAACEAGTCRIACAAGFGNCDGDAANGCETDLLADPTNCAACGTACDATHGTPSCSAGVCGIACAPGFADCDGSPANGCEVDLSTDAGHCGACGTACGSVNGTGTCSAGLCLTSCDAGFASCDGSAANGCEVTLASNTANCGACGHACSSAGGVADCDAGACRITCAAGFADCNGDVADGCEVTLASDPAHCGACGTACSSTNGTATCAGSTCGITCAAGFANCDGSAANGCEVNTLTDATHCGACGTACSSANGTASCGNGACAITCAAGFANCDGSAANGCEVNTLTDAGHCGACGTVCGSVNGTASCGAGACGLACNPGYADCDGLNADGCEVSVLSDVANCGGCGIACVVANGAPACLAGGCAVAACSGSFADCNHSVTDGCEVDLATDAANCGACASVCTIAHGSGACSAGGCVVAACDPGWADCNGNPADGCEVSVADDAANCGACGTVCSIAHGSAACGAGRCAVGACNAGWGDCNGNPADGCEVDTGSSLANCGGCGQACAPANSAAAACVTGACLVTACNPNFFDMNGQPGDGCECAGDANGSVCSAPSGGNVLSPGQLVAFSGSLAPLGKTEYFQVTFSGNSSPSYHPAVSISSPGGFARFDVLAPGCGAPASGCATEGGSSVALTAWEASNAALSVSCFSSLGGCIFPPLPGSGGTVVIRVYAAASTSTCGTFSLTVGN